MSSQQTDVTAKKNARHSKRKVYMLLAYSLIPAAFVAGVVLFIGIIATHPRYVARATFEINWNAMPSGPNDEEAEKILIAWRKHMIAEVTSLPDSEQELSDVLGHDADFTGSQTDKANLISKLQRRLHVALTSQANNCDLFAIEVQGDNPNAAQAAANRVLHGVVSKLKSEADFGGVLATARSGADMDDTGQKEENLQAEEQTLEETYSRPFPDDVQERYDQIEAELEKLQFDHIDAGFGFLSNLGGLLLADPIKVVKEAQVEKRGAGHERDAFLAAAVSGGMAGIFGSLLCLFVLTAKTPKSVTRSVPPVIRQMQVPKPPILPHCPPPVLRNR